MVSLWPCPKRELRLNLHVGSPAPSNQCRRDAFALPSGGIYGAVLTAQSSQNRKGINEKVTIMCGSGNCSAVCVGTGVRDHDHNNDRRNGNDHYVHAWHFHRSEG